MRTCTHVHSPQLQSDFEGEKAGVGKWLLALSWLQGRTNTAIDHSGILGGNAKFGLVYPPPPTIGAGGSGHGSAPPGRVKAEPLCDPLERSGRRGNGRE